jgi:hypothetical protein
MEFLVPAWEQHVDSYRVFYQVGKEFERGATSLRAVSKALEARERAGTLPCGIPLSTASLSRECAKVRLLIAARLDLGYEAPLCMKNGVGREMSGLTDLGWRAWDWIRHSLIRHRLLLESD